MVLTDAPVIRKSNGDGEVAERLNAPVLKTGMGASPSWVRIPPSPPLPPKSLPQYKSRSACNHSRRKMRQSTLFDVGIWLEEHSQLTIDFSLPKTPYLLDS